MAKIDIYLDPKKKRRPASQEPRRGPLQPARAPEYLPRRLIAFGIRFYDLAQILVSGSYQLIDYHLPAVLSDSGTGVGLNEPTLADYTAMADKIFEVPVAEFETKYREVTYEMLRNAVLMRMRAQSDAGGGLSSTSDLFTARGLKLTQAILEGNNFFYANQTGQITGAFHNDITLTGSFKRKITSVRDHSAAAVPFTPGSKDKVFLMPIMAAPHSEWTASTPTSLVERWADAWRPVPRDPYVDPSSPHYNAPLSSTDYATSHSNLDRFRSFELDPKGGRNDNGTFSVIDPGTIPDPAWWPESGPGPNHFSDTSTWQTKALPAGVLVAVIKQGSSYFYAWT